MDLISGREAADLLRSWRSTLAEEATRLSASERRSETQRAAVAREHEAAWEHLLTELVPNLAPPALDAAAARVGLTAIGAAAMAARREERARSLAGTRSQVEANPRWPRRAAELNAIDIRLASLDELIAALEASLRALDDEPMFAELVRAGYGTSAYRGRFWQLSYYRHWRRGDEIVAAHGPRLDATTFGAIRGKYSEESQARDTLVAEATELRATREAIAALERQYAEAGQALARLDEWSLATARALAREHLAALPESDLRGLFAPDHGLLVAVQRVAGTGAKARYIEGLAAEWHGDHGQDVRRRMAKLDAGIEKLSRPKNAGRRFDRDEIAAKYAPPHEAWQQRWDSYEQATQQIVVFQDYGAAPLTNFLWWDLMTHHAAHAHFLEDEVYAHSHRHRHVGDAVGAALAGGRPTFGGDPS